MAVLPMKRINLCALKKDRKSILEALQRKGVIEVTDVMQEDSVFKRDDVSEAADVFVKNIQTVKNALEILDTYAPEKKSLLSSLEGRTAVPASQYSEFDKKRDTAYKYALKLVALSKTINEDKAELLKLDSLIDALSPWATLDISPNFTGTKSTAAFIGTLPGTWTEEALYELLADFTPLEVSVISVLREQTCLCVMSLKNCSEKLYELLRANGFARPAISGNLPPAQQQKAYEAKIAELRKEIEESGNEIKALADKRDMLKFYSDYELMRKEKYEVIDRLMQSAHTFILTGYISAGNADALTKELEERYDISVQTEDPDENDDVPVIFKNNGFSRPLETVTESYSPPGKGELDPTFAMSLFYYLLFGIMFSDAGYGLLLTIITTIVLAKYKNMEGSMKNFVRMFQFCGISTTFWGIIFGSYFGNVVDIISGSFFGETVTIKPLWFSMNDEPMRMLVVSMVLGLVHLFAGLIMKFIQCVKQKKYFDGFCDSILWMLLVGSLVVVLMSVQTFVDIINVETKLEGIVPQIATYVALASALGIILTAGRESKNPAKRLLKGAYGLYGVTSYLSDILSYSRLLALGLATGVIASVFNQMGSMAGSGIVKVIIFILVFIIGQVLNFLINILGAYVHTNRLQYVEFFGKFYEGGGRMFEPFSAKTKFYKIKEN